jgi:hypothetical protein
MACDWLDITGRIGMGKLGTSVLWGIVLRSELLLIGQLVVRPLVR